MIKEKSIVILFSLFFFSTNITLAGSDTPISLSSLIAEAIENNPQIQASYNRYKAALARVKLLRSLEDPKFEYEYDKITADMDAVMNGKTAPMRTFAISQEFPFPTKLFLRKQAARKEADAFWQDYKEKERKVIKELKEAYYQLFLSNKKILLTQENQNLLAQFIEVLNKKYSVNKATQQDVLKAQVEYSKLANQLVLLQQEEKIAQAMLASLLSRPLDARIIIPEDKDNKDLELSEEKILILTKENRPELKSFKEMVRKSEIDYALAKQEYLPDFMIKYKREEKDGSAGPWAGMIGMTIPLWFWEKQNSFVKEAKANSEEVKAEYNASENMVLFEAKSAYARFEAAKKLVEIYETGVLPQVQSAFEVARHSYEAEKIDFLDLLDTQRSLREFQMEYVESLANLKITLADLERSVGVDFIQQNGGGDEKKK